MTTLDTDVRVEITVAAPIERAFTVFTDKFDTWWPAGHHLGAADLAAVVLEPRPGGRWYERSVDGAECDWGQVLVWDAPRHIAMSWAISPAWEPAADPAQASRIDVRFSRRARTPRRSPSPIPS